LVYYTINRSTNIGANVNEAYNGNVRLNALINTLHTCTLHAGVCGCNRLQPIRDGCGTIAGNTELINDVGVTFSTYLLYTMS
jgi:hypothetical protein